MWDFLSSRNDADLVQCANFWTQTAVYAEDLSVDNGGQCEEIEDLTTCLPHRSIAVLCLALLVETVDLCDLPRLVVSSDKGDSVGESMNVSQGQIGGDRFSYFAFKHINRVNVSKLK